MYERFTDRARKVMQLAKREAMRSNRECVEAEHVLLGLLAEGSGVAANVLRNLGFDLDELRGSVEWRLEFGLAPPSKGKLPLAPRAKQLIEHSMEEARKLGHNYVGTEHLLLGLTRQTEGVVVEVLAEASLTSEIIRKDVQRAKRKTVSGDGCRQRPEAPLAHRRPEYPLPRLRPRRA